MSTFLILQNRVLDATLRGGTGNRDQVKEDINEAIKQVDLELRPSVTSATIVLTAGQVDYSIATNFGIAGLVSLRDVQYTSINGPQTYPLEEFSPSDLRAMRQNSNLLASTWVTAYAVDGLDLFMIYPATQSVGDAIKLYYTPRQADLVADGDIPLYLPPEWHEIYELAAIQRSMRQSSPEYAASYTQMYEHKLDQYRKWQNKRRNARSRRALVGRYGRRLVPHDNSADWR